MREILQMDRIMEKLTILSAAARYDVACTSSGVQRGGDGTHTGNAYASGICHAFTGDGRCISLLKILYTNDCIYDCKYCRNRCSNDVKRVSFTPEEICKLTMEFYRRNYIEGLFLSSGILHSPDYTMGLLYETLYLLRTKYHFNGYIHVKGIPGASADLLELTGYLADRMSVNLELPTADALRQIAPNKVRKNILSPMRQLQNGIRQSREFHGVSSMKSRMYLDEKTYYNQMAEMKESYARLQDYHDGIAAIREHKARQSAVQSWGEEIAGGENSSRVRNVQKKLPQTTRQFCAQCAIIAAFLYIRGIIMRIVVKVGTSTLAHATGRLNIQRMERLCKVLSDLKNAGHEIILVSSGAIGMGVGKLSLSARPKDMPTKQAAAAIGQCELMYIYDKLFSEYNHIVAQLLITAPDLAEGGSRKAHFHNTLARLLELGALPVINENDTVSTDEIVIGDNDTLSAIVSATVSADLLILLSDIDGLYDRDPRRDPDAKLIETVPVIDARILSLAGDKGSELATGGMVTKLHAAQIATASGCEMVIANGEKPEVLYDIVGGKRVGTRFLIPKSEEELL